MLRLRQIAYCLHIRGIDCHTPVYPCIPSIPLHTQYTPASPVYPCIPSIPLHTQYTLYTQYTPTCVYPVYPCTCIDLPDITRYVLKTFIWRLEMSSSYIMPPWNLDSVKCKAVKIFWMNSNAIITIRGSQSFRFKSSEQRMNAQTQLWKTTDVP